MIRLSVLWNFSHCRHIAIFLTSNMGLTPIARSYRQYSKHSCKASFTPRTITIKIIILVSTPGDDIDIICLFYMHAHLPLKILELVIAGWILIGCQCLYSSSAGKSKIVLKVIAKILFLRAFIVIAVVWTLLFFDIENDF